MSDRWAELRLKTSQTLPTPQQDEQANRSVPYFTGTETPAVESSVQVHGLYEEDIAAGIVCGTCKYWADAPDQFGRKRSYRDIVLANHGVTPT